MEVMIKKDNVILDATVLTSLMACERYIDFRFNKNLIPASGSGNPIEAGLVVHKIMEEYSKSIMNGVHRNTAIQVGMDAGIQLAGELPNIPQENVKDDSGKLKQVGFAWIMTTMQQYFEFYKNDSWTPISAEQVKRTLVYEDDDIRVLWVSKLDRMVDTFQQGTMPMDHKTMKQNRSPILLNNQFMGQCISAQSVRMCVDKIGFQTTLKPDKKFVREIMNYNREQLAEQIQTIGYYAKYLVDLNKHGYFPPRYIYCDKYNGCIFRRVCESLPSDRERMLKLHFVVGDEWNPAAGEDVGDD
jgi:hypothetical protein